MIGNHLSEEEVQQFTLNESNASADTAEHLLVCEICKVRVETYKLLFTGLGEQTPPSFDFNLTDLVLTALPQTAAKPTVKKGRIYLFILGMITILSIPLYYYWDYLSNLINGITDLLIYLAVTTVTTVLVIQSIDLHKTYQKKIKALDMI